MTNRTVLLSAVAELRNAADLLEIANDVELLDDVEAILKSTAATLKAVRKG